MPPARVNGSAQSFFWASCVVPPQLVKTIDSARAAPDPSVAPISTATAVARLLQAFICLPSSIDRKELARAPRAGFSAHHEGIGNGRVGSADPDGLGSGVVEDGFRAAL